MRIFPAAIFLSGFFIISSCSHDKNQEQDSVVIIDTASTDKQLSSLNSKIAQDPGNPELLHQRAQLLINQKKYQEALSDMQKVLSLDSTQSKYFLTMADISFAANRTFDAKSFLEKAIALDPDNTDAMLRLAELNLIVRQYAQSVSLLNKVLEKDKKNTTALFMRGMNYKENGDTVRAISDFQSAVEADPDFYNAYMQLGILNHLKNNPAAEGYFTQALRISPASEEALYGRGLWYQDHNELNKAIQDYTTIIQMNPKNRNAHFNLGYIHQIILKVYPEAIKHYSNAITADSNYTEAFYNRGLCYEAVGNIRDAAADYKKALMLRPVYPPAEAGLKRVTQ
jgi:tetratricopeptide (TPR) repeat protein